MTFSLEAAVHKVCSYIANFLCLPGTQFRRCLDEHLGLRLSEADYEFLSDKYDQKKSGRINYRAFSEALENGECGGVRDGVCVENGVHDDV